MSDNNSFVEDPSFPPNNISPSEQAEITFAPPVVDYSSLPEDDFVLEQEGPSDEVSTDPPTSELSQRAPPVYHKLPSNIKAPSASYFCDIVWGNGYDQWNIVRFGTPMDGSCLFHAIANSFFEPYHTERLNGKPMSRSQIVQHFRKELADQLASPISNDPQSPIYYDVLNHGNTSTFAKAVPEFSLEHMQRQLNSHVPIGYGYMEFIGEALNKDIYILEAARRDIYITDELPLTIKGDRRSIILYYMNGHYELVGIRNSDNSFDTHFAPNHSLIRFLYARVQYNIHGSYLS